LTADTAASITHRAPNKQRSTRALMRSGHAGCTDLELSFNPNQKEK